MNFKVNFRVFNFRVNGRVRTFFVGLCESRGNSERAMGPFRDAVERVMGRTDDQQLDRALMASVQKQLTEVADAVAAVRPLAELSDPEKRECAKTSAIRRYPARSIVYGGYRVNRF